MSMRLRDAAADATHRMVGLCSFVQSPVAANDCGGPASLPNIMASMSAPAASQASAAGSERLSGGSGANSCMRRSSAARRSGRGQRALLYECNCSCAHRTAARSARGSFRARSAPARARRGAGRCLTAEGTRQALLQQPAMANTHPKRIAHDANRLGVRQSARQSRERRRRPAQRRESARVRGGRAASHALRCRGGVLAASVPQAAGVRLHRHRQHIVRRLQVEVQRQRAGIRKAEQLHALEAVAVLVMRQRLELRRKKVRGTAVRKTGRNLPGSPPSRRCPSAQGSCHTDRLRVHTSAATQSEARQPRAPEMTCSGASDSSSFSVLTYSLWRCTMGGSRRAAAASLYIFRLGTLASVVALKMKTGIFTWLPISSSTRETVAGATVSVNGARSMLSEAGSSYHTPARKRQGCKQ